MCVRTARFENEIRDTDSGGRGGDTVRNMTQRNVRTRGIRREREDQRALARLRGARAHAAGTFEFRRARGSRVRAESFRR